MKNFFHITSKQLSLDSPRLALPVGPLENLLPHIRHHPPPAAPPSRPLDWPAGPHCPQCRGRFFRRAPLPRPTEHGWRQLVAPTGLRRELAAGLRACVELPPDEVEALLSNYADDDFLSGEQMYEILKSVTDQRPETAGRCPCGRMHVRRGDRVKRGKGQAEDGRRMARQLGSIVRLLEGDLAQGRERRQRFISTVGLVQKAMFCNPAFRLFLLAQEAPFWELAADVQKLQELTLDPLLGTGLSSAAAEELLLRVHPPEKRAEVPPEDLAKCGRQLGEEMDGDGGPVNVNARAAAVVSSGLPVPRNIWAGKVLVETSGICECKIWYPRLAVVPVYDPDLEEEPQFNVNDHVECKMQSGWEPGVVKEVLWLKGQRCGPVPYTARDTRAKRTGESTNEQQVMAEALPGRSLLESGDCS
ncbi:unnamed protein product [Durusdinium trenchii]|uniref:Uncharacterized protein n=1 Tax=Durusdinium trenchii TaxID=1381693 RepID=A0ABP0KCW5_9DINO